MAIFGIAGLAIGGIAGYLVRLPGAGALMSRTTHDAVLRAMILAVAGLLTGAAIGWVMDRRDG